MVMLQVDEVNALFEEIDVLRKNGWKVGVFIFNFVFLCSINCFVADCVGR